MSVFRVAMFVSLCVLSATAGWATTPGVQASTDLGTRTLGATAVDAVTLSSSSGAVQATQSRAMSLVLLGQRIQAGSLTSTIREVGGEVVSTLLLEVGGRVLSLPGNRSFHYPLFKASRPYQFGILSCSVSAEGSVSVDTRTSSSQATDSLRTSQNGVTASLGALVSAGASVASASARVSGTATPVAGDLSLVTGFNLAGTRVTSVDVSADATLSGCAAIDVCLELLGRSWKKELARWAYEKKQVYAHTWTI